MRQFSIFMWKRRKQSLTVCSSFITCPAHWVVHWLWAIKQQNLSMVARLKSALVTVTCSSLSAKLSKNTITRYEFLYVTGFSVTPIQMSFLTNDRFTFFKQKSMINHFRHNWEAGTARLRCHLYLRATVHRATKAMMNFMFVGSFSNWLGRCPTTRLYTVMVTIDTCFAFTNAPPIHNNTRENRIFLWRTYRCEALYPEILLKWRDR